MKSIRQEIYDLFINKEEPKREKKTFWATDSEKMDWEIWAEFKGIPRTNPIKPMNKMGLKVRDYVEKVITEEFRVKDLIYEAEGKKQNRIELERYGVKVSGYIDMIRNDNEINKIMPVEAKTTGGFMHQKDLDANKPSTSYLKQLAFYMDYLKVDIGCLYYVFFDVSAVLLPKDIYEFYLVRDKNNIDIFNCYRLDTKDSKLKYVNISINIDEVWKKYKNIWEKYVEKDIEPPIDKKYKYNIETINWKEQPTSKISNARNGSAVIGDWEIKYSDWKNLLIEKEAKAIGKTFKEYVGYSKEELNRIKEITAGYTTKAWKQ